MASKTATAEKIARVGQRPQVVIPREMLDTLNIHVGDFVAFTRRTNGVIMKPKRPADDTVLTPQEPKMVRRGMKQIQRGRFKLWRDVKNEMSR